MIRNKARYDSEGLRLTHSQNLLSPLQRSKKPGPGISNLSSGCHFQVLDYIQLSRIEGGLETSWFESRKVREKSKLKRAIIETARSIAINEGFEAVTIRRIASAIEYGPPAIYALFENKEAIFSELIHGEFGQLLQVMQNSYNREIEPEARLLGLARSYWDYAENCPQMFNAMHGMVTPPIGPAPGPESFKYLQAIVSDVLEDIFKPRQLSQEELDEMVQLLRGTMQGLVSIGLSGRIQGGRERVLALIERAVKDYLKAWRQD